MAGQWDELIAQVQQYAEKAPLTKTREHAEYMDGLAAFQAAFANVLEKTAARRLQEETPVHGAVPELMVKQSNQGRQSANVLATASQVYRKQHASDFERLDNPRNREEQLDYENNKE